MNSSFSIGTVVNEGRPRIVGLGTGDLVTEPDRLVAMAHGVAQPLDLGRHEPHRLVPACPKRLAGHRHANAHEIRHHLVAGIKFRMPILPEIGTYSLVMMAPSTTSAMSAL